MSASSPSSAGAPVGAPLVPAANAPNEVRTGRDGNLWRSSATWRWVPYAQGRRTASVSTEGSEEEEAALPRAQSLPRAQALPPQHVMPTLSIYDDIEDSPLLGARVSPASFGRSSPVGVPSRQRSSSPESISSFSSEGEWISARNEGAAAPARRRPAALTSGKSMRITFELKQLLFQQPEAKVKARLLQRTEFPETLFSRIANVYNTERLPLWKTIVQDVALELSETPGIPADFRIQNMRLHEDGEKIDFLLRFPRKVPASKVSEAVQRSLAVFLPESITFSDAAHRVVTRLSHRNLIVSVME